MFRHRLRHPLRGLRRRLRLLRGQRFVDVEIDGFKITLDLARAGVSQALYFNRDREAAFMSLIRRTVARGAICLDIGANLGHCTLLMLRLTGPGGRVFAVEPDPYNVELLERNVRQNPPAGCCLIEQCIISDRDGESDFWLADSPNLHSVARTAHSVRQIRVPAVSLATFLETRGHVHFIKMDVEGHEVAILRSGLAYFARSTDRVDILLEVHPARYHRDNDLATVLRAYFDIGFRPRYVVSTPVARPRLFRAAGYRPIERFATDGVRRGLYTDIAPEDLIRFACAEHCQGSSRKIVRSFMLSRGDRSGAPGAASTPAR